MAPLQPQRPEKDKRIRAILSFAADLEKQLPAASAKPPGSLFSELEKRISDFPNNLGQASASNTEEIDSHGTTLWNLCTRLRRNFDSDKPQDVPILLLMTRVFAFQLLNYALESEKTNTANIVRLMKIGLKAAKNCVDRKEGAFALKVLEKLGGYELLLKDADGGDYDNLIAEYYILRTALAWDQDQFDVAEHMFKKSMSAKKLFCPNSTESLADILYEMGKDLLFKKQHAMAAKWLERSYEVLCMQELDKLSMDARELRVSTLESLIKSLLGLRNQESVDKARSFVDLLESEVGDKLIVLLLRLDLLFAVTDDIFDSNSYFDIVQRMTRSVVLTDPNIRLIVHHIRKLADKSPSLACKALDELLELRILPSKREEWIERTLVIRVWMATHKLGSTDTLLSLEQVLSTAFESLGKPVEPAVALAAHTLLWKRIESNYTEGQYDAAEHWCRLALHRVFEYSGDVNIARISRKLLLCALSRQDTNSARDTYGSMSDVARNEPMTRFLMYKISLRCGDMEFAAECLQIISSSSKEPTLLYACVLDAQQLGNKSQALLALHLVLENQDYDIPITVHLPSLIRCTIGLTSAILGGSENTTEGFTDQETNVERLCVLFERAVTDMKRVHPPTYGSRVVWTVAELDWFSKNSYNLAIKNLSIWNPRQSFRMLTCCINFIDNYPGDMSDEASDDLSLRKMFCEFSAAIALVALARGEDVIEIQLQDYLNLRKHIDSFDSILQDKLEKLAGRPAEDLIGKLAVLLGFDFEAACRLKAWDSLGEVILKAEVCKSPRLYELMADCILSSQAPTKVLVTTLKKIINQAWSLESLDSIKLTKYMRCLFQVALTDSPDVAEQLLEQVRGLAEETSESDEPYPTEELEWIATRAFNHAVDLYCSGQDDSCRTWASKAQNIAQFCNDNGALEKVLQEKFLVLKWNTR